MIYKHHKKEIFKANVSNTKIVSTVRFQNVNGIKILRIKKDLAKYSLPKQFILILFNT